MLVLVALRLSGGYIHPLALLMAAILPG
jgi:hypothetical protein